MNTLKKLQEQILLVTALRRRKLLFYQIIVLLSVLYILVILGCFMQFLVPSFITILVIVLGMFSFLYAILLKNGVTTTANTLASEFFIQAIQESVPWFIHYYDAQFDQETFLKCVAQNMKKHTTAYLRMGKIRFNWELPLYEITTEVKGQKFTYFFQSLVLIDHRTCCVAIDQENIGIMFHYKKVWFHGHEAIVENEKRIYFSKDINQGV